MIIATAVIFSGFSTISGYVANAATGNLSSSGSIAASAVGDATTTSNNLVASVIAHDNNNITIAWEKPADYNNISDYNVYVNGTLVGDANNNKASQSKKFIDSFYSTNSSAQQINMHNYIVTGLTPNTSYNFVVKAIDSKGNILTQSSTITQSTDITQAVEDVTNYGAVGDGTTVDTAAIQKVINNCPAGGEVLLPAGKIFKSGALWLKDNMTLRVDGELLGSDNAQDYISAQHPVAAKAKIMHLLML